MIKKILLISMLLLLGTLKSWANYDVLDIPNLNKYIRECSIKDSGICIEKAVRIEASNTILIKIILDYSYLGESGEEPELYLELAMLSYLLMFNDSAADMYDVKDSFIDLDIDVHGQRNVAIVGEIISDKEKYVGYYRVDGKTGYLSHDIDDKFDDPVNYFIISNRGRD